MGKWAQYSKRGSSKSFGTIAAPAPADFSIGTVTATTIPVNRLASFPAGADRMEILVVRVSTGAIAYQNQGNTTPLTATGLTTLTQYRVYTAWTFNLTRISEYSAPVLVTTT